MDGERADPKPTSYDADDRASFEVIHDLREVRHEELALPGGREVVSRSQEYERRLRKTPVSKQGAEVCVGGDDDTAVFSGCLHDHLVGRREQADG